MLDPYIGEIAMFAGTFAPRGWALCDGQLLPIANNTALFSIIGTIYGGDGRTTFALPDLRGRAPMHAGQGPGLSPRQIGEIGGSETVTLNTREMPSHNHGAAIAANQTAQLANVQARAVASSGLPNQSNPALHAWAPSGSGSIYSSGAVNTPMAAGTVEVTAGDVDISGRPVAVQPTGGSEPHDNMQPYLAINYIIALEGIFPSRE